MTRRSQIPSRILASGILGAALLAFTAAPPASAADPAVVGQAIQLDDPEATEGVATADVPRLDLTVDGSNTLLLGSGEPLVATLRLGTDVVGFDGVLTFDSTALEFGGAQATSAGTELAVSPRADGRVGLAAFVEAGRPADPATVEIRLITRRSGQIDIAFDAFDAVNADGASLTEPPTVSGTVSVDDDATVIEAPDAGPEPDNAPATDDTPDVDVTRNGVIDETDVAEVLLGWDELAATGDPCATDTVRMRQLDVNGDGCLGVEDLAAVSNAATPAAPLAAPTAQMATTPALVVTATHDGGDNQLNDDLCISNLGGCSLRAAIQQANATAGPNTIEFDIPGSGPHTIIVNDKLPTLNDLTGGVTIDGYTQPGASVNTDPYQSNANVEIIVRPVQYVSNRPLFAITSSDNEIRGLSIIDQSFKVNITGALAVRNKIVGNFIGTDPSGTFSDSNGFRIGVRIVNGANNNIVGTPDLADRNVLTGNRSWGMRIEQNDSDHNVVQNNIFGLNPDGSDDLPQGGGIDVQFGPEFTLIGGRAQYEHNVFSGLNSAGIDFSHNTFNNMAIGNYIGTDLTGNTGFPYTDNHRGIWIKDDARFNIYEDNIIVNSTTDGVYNKHNYTGGNTFINNRFGVTLDGTALGNGGNGVVLRGHEDVYEGNVFANNGGAGIYLDSNNDSGANGNERTDRNRLSRNSFYNNGGLAIDITPNGQNTNDPGDGDTGTQAQLNHPEFSSVVVGQAAGTACAACEVEIYLADGGEGRQYLGTAMADGGGSFTYADARLTAGFEVTALTIDTLMNTSEFAPAQSVGGGASPWTELTGTFFESTFNGVPLAYTSDNGGINNSGADGTTSFANFDLVAPTAGDYTLEAQVYAPNGGSNSFWVIVDNAPGDGFLWDVETSSSIGTDLVNDRGNGGVGNGATVVVNLSAGIHRIGVALREDGTGIATMALRPVGGGGGTTAPLITNPGSQLDARNSALSLQLAATPSDTNFWALNLPDGLAVDTQTGLISGTPTREGLFAVTVWATNFAGISAQNFDWTIDTEQLPPEITPIADQSNTNGDVIALQATATDPNGDTIDFSASGLPVGVVIDPTTGVISGTIDFSGLTSTTLTTTVTAADANGSDSTTFAWTLEPGFTCTASGTTLSWTNVGASTYYIRLQLDGADSFIGSTNGTTFQMPSQYGIYEVINYLNGRQSTSCTAPGGPTSPSFDCSVSAGTLSWNDQGVTRYYIRYAVNGAPSSYLGSSTTLTFPATAQYGTYTVIANTPAGQKTTDCDAPGGPNAPSFDCATSGTTLSWNDQSVATYYIRYAVNGGPSSYLGSSTTLSYEIPNQYGVYTVIAYTAAGRKTTNCDAPGGPVAP